MLGYISHDQLQQDEGEVGGITSPEAVAVAATSSRWSTAQEECEVGEGPLAVADVELYIT
jgi:hypothetical protein